MTANKKNRILNAAIKILARKGYQFASIAEIATEAGVSKGLVHVYFESKLDILLEVILLFIGSVNELIAIKLTYLYNPVARLHAVFDAFMELMSHDNRDLYWGHILREGLPATDQIKDGRLREKYSRIADEAMQLQHTLDGIIADGQRQGVIDASLKPQVIRQMLGGASQMLHQGLALASHGRAPAVYDEADVRQAMAVLIDKFIIQ